MVSKKNHLKRINYENSEGTKVRYQMVSKKCKRNERQQLESYLNDGMMKTGPKHHKREWVKIQKSGTKWPVGKPPKRWNVENWSKGSQEGMN